MSSNHTTGQGGVGGHLEGLRGSLGGYFLNRSIRIGERLAEVDMRKQAQKLSWEDKERLQAFQYST